MLTYFIIGTALVLFCVNAQDVFKSFQFEYEFKDYLRRFKTIFANLNGTIQYEQDTLILICQGDYTMINLITDVFPPFEKTMSASRVSIQDCKLPVTPLVGLFQKLNINVTAIEMLRISINHMEPLPQGNYTTGLSVKSLWIDTKYVKRRNFLINNPDFLNPLTNLTTLMLYGTKLIPLPKSIHLEVLSVQENSVIESWDTYCEYLRELQIRKLMPEDIPEVWPEKCSQLTSLQLRGLNLMAMERVINSGINRSCKNLRSLLIYACNQDEPPLIILDAAKDLVYLNISINRLNDKALSNFPLMRNLTHLDLSRNWLTGWALFDLVKQLPSLQYLNLDGNHFVNLFCNYETRISSFTSHVTSLEWLSLRNMPMDLKCLSTAYFSKLRYLNLGLTENIEFFSPTWLPKSNATHLEIDLRGRTVEKFYTFSERTYNNLVNGDLKDLWGISHGYNTNVTVWLTSIDCDCENYWFVKCLRDLPHLLSFPGLICSNSGVEVLNEPSDNIDCTKSTRVRNCVLRHIGYQHDSPNKKTAKVDCHSGMESEDLYPEYNNDNIRTVSLNVSGDAVTSLKHMELTKWLRWLDLRNNQIARLDANDSSRLFALPERRVWMSGNIFVCDCDNKPLLDALHEHRHQVLDFEALTCIDTGKPLSSVTSFDVCQVGLRIALAISGIFACVILVAAVYLWRNRLRLKIYLYSRGLCLFCLREEDLDSDKPYDAFLSFAHGDMEYVNEVLLPNLEGEPHSYRVCVHYRDWVVGDWIPAQIMRSVSLSKRTIILLSRNFIASMWASLEFRYAMASATQEGRTRLLVLILDDVLSEPMDTEMQGYLNYNTYLCCDDPWFWEKLRYAMPHRKHGPAAPVFTPSSHTPNPVLEEILMEPLPPADSLHSD